MKERLKLRGGFHSFSTFPNASLPSPPPLPVLLLLSVQVSQLHFQMFDYHVSVLYKMVHNRVITHMFPTMTEQKHSLCLVVETKQEPFIQIFNFPKMKYRR